MFADDKNPFFSSRNINVLFNIVNLELCKVAAWFKMQTNYHYIKIRPNIPYSIKLTKKKRKSSLTTSIAAHK